MAPSRARVVYSCGACGAAGPTLGRALPDLRRVGHGGRGGRARRRARRGALGPGARRSPASRTSSTTPPARMATGIAELDRVLGGGLVPGSLVLLGGEPGIGKSTLVLQALAEPRGARAPRPMLVTGEESPIQVRGRAERLDADCGPIQVLAETRLESVLAAIEAHQPVGLRDRLGADAPLGRPRRRAGRAQPGAPGHRRADARGQGARRHDPAGGPGDQGRRPRRPAHPRAPGGLRALVRGRRPARAPRAARHQEPLRLHQRDRPASRCARPGSCRVEDPTRLYLAEAGERVGLVRLPRRSRAAARCWSRCRPWSGPTEIVPPRRVAIGVDRTRLAQVIAVLSRHAGVRLGDADVFVSVAGGARALDPAADLAMALAVTSAHRGRPARRRARWRSASWA